MSILEGPQDLKNTQSSPGLWAVAGLVTGLVASLLWMIFLGWAAGLAAVQVGGWLQRALGFS
jgi:hypothetical protein